MYYKIDLCGRLVAQQASAVCLSLGVTPVEFDSQRERKVPGSIPKCPQWKRSQELDFGCAQREPGGPFPSNTSHAYTPLIPPLTHLIPPLTHLIPPLTHYDGVG